MKVERKVFNSVRLLYGFQLTKRYENITNLILSYGGRIHGSQYQISGTNGYDRIAVYFEIPTENINDFATEETQLNTILKDEIDSRPKKTLPLAHHALSDKVEKQ